jgi:hypothetical protein
MPEGIFKSKTRKNPFTVRGIGKILAELKNSICLDSTRKRFIERSERKFFHSKGYWKGIYGTLNRRIK